MILKIPSVLQEFFFFQIEKVSTGSGENCTSPRCCTWTEVTLGIYPGCWMNRSGAALPGRIGGDGVWEAGHEPPMCSLIQKTKGILSCSKSSVASRVRKGILPLMRPHLQHCIQLWSPQNRKDMELLSCSRGGLWKWLEGWSISHMKKGWENWSIIASLIALLHPLWLTREDSNS